jgi:hypothetical protein
MDPTRREVVYCSLTSLSEEGLTQEDLEKRKKSRRLAIRLGTSGASLLKVLDRPTESMYQDYIRWLRSPFYLSKTYIFSNGRTNIFVREEVTNKLVGFLQIWEEASLKEFPGWKLHRENLQLRLFREKWHSDEPQK